MAHISLGNPLVYCKKDIKYRYFITIYSILIIYKSSCYFKWLVCEASVFVDVLASVSSMKVYAEQVSGPGITVDTPSSDGVTYNTDTGAAQEWSLESRVFSLLHLLLSSCHL